MSEIILKITEKEKENIQKELEKTKLGKITVKITEKTKTIKLDKKAQTAFQNAGVKVSATYSYGNNKSLCDTILEIAKNHPEMFVIA